MREAPPRVEKPWGYEDILERNQDFVVKRILLRAGNRSSLQLHERKREWVEVVEGTIELTIGPDEDRLETRELSAGDVYRVPAKTIHRVLAVEDALILEVCTPGDDDIVRLDDDYGRRGQNARRPGALARLRGLWVGPREHMAALVLVAGLLVAGVVVSFAPAVSLPQLHAYSTDGTRLWDVGRIVVKGWISPLYDPFTTGHLRLLTVVLTLVYVTSVTSLGALIVNALRGAEDWPRLARVLAGFLPGFLMVIAPLQILFAALPFVTAAWIGFAGVTCTAVAVHRRTLRETAVRLRDDTAYRSGFIRLAWGVAGVVGLAALWKIQVGRSFMVSDSITVFLRSATRQLHGQLGDYLRQWDQQSDEWLFSAPLMFTSRAGRDFEFPLYVTQFMGMASFCALVFGIVRTFAARRRNLAAGLATGLIFVGTPASQPIFYIALGAGTPALFVHHPGRYLAIVAPWLVLLLWGGLRERRAVVAVGAAACGVGFVSVHVAVYVIATIFVIWLWQRLQGGRAQLFAQRRPQLGLHALAASALAAPFLVYGLLRRVGDPSPLAWLLVAGAVIGMGGVAVAALGSVPTPRAQRRTTTALVLGGMLILGFALSNNLTNGLTDGGIRSALATILPGYDRPLGTRALLGPSPFDGLAFPDFSGSICWLSGHCLSVGGYIAGYAFVSILAACSWLALGRVDDDAATNRMRAAWLAMVAALCVSFILIDFTGAGQGQAWILTRFMEVPYYGLLAFAAVALVGSRDRLTAGVGVLVLGAWTLVPVLYNLLPLQLIKNADWLVSLVA